MTESDALRARARAELAPHPLDLTHLDLYDAADRAVALAAASAIQRTCQLLARADRIDSNEQPSE